MSLKTLKLAQIVVADRLRHVDEVEAMEIAASVEADGLHYPIIVRRTDAGEYAVVDGAHRYRAFELLGREEIACDVRKLTKVDAERIEIDSNLIRADLTKAARIKFIGKSNDLFKRQNPNRGHGGDRRSSNFKFPSWELENPTSYLQARIELSQSAIYRALELYKKLQPEALDLLAQGPLADNEAQIREVSKLGPDQQIACAQSLLDGSHEAVRDWRIAVGDLTEATDPANRQDAWFAKTISYWGEGKKKWKRDFVRENQKDIRALLAEIDAEGDD